MFSIIGMAQSRRRQKVHTSHLYTRKLRWKEIEEGGERKEGRRVKEGGKERRKRKSEREKNRKRERMRESTT